MSSAATGRPCSAPARCCAGCRHFVAAAGALEAQIAGLKILSSAYGSVRANTGLCLLRDLFRVPEQSCPEWTAAKANTAE